MSRGHRVIVAAFPRTVNEYLIGALARPVAIVQGTKDHAGTTANVHWFADQNAATSAIGLGHIDNGGTIWTAALTVPAAINDVAWDSTDGRVDIGGTSGGVGTLGYWNTSGVYTSLATFGTEIDGIAADALTPDHAQAVGLGTTGGVATKNFKAIMVAADGHWYMVGSDGYIGYGVARGVVTGTQLIGTDLWAITELPAGTFWVADFGGGALLKAVFATGTFTVTTYTLPQSGKPTGVSLGPSGDTKIYVLDQVNNCVRQFDPAFGQWFGVVGLNTASAISASIRTPRAMTPTQDGLGIFVCESAVGKIAKIT